MNATARRIDNLFEKSGIVWLFPVISAWAPRGCERKYTDPALLLLIKAVSQEWDYFCFFSLFFSLWICLCHTDQSHDEKRCQFLWVNNRIFHVCLMQDSLMQSFGGYKVLFSSLLFFHLLFSSFLSIGSADYIVLGLVQKNTVVFRLKDLRQRKLFLIHETILSSSIQSYP